MKVNGWKYYNHAAIPTTAPHEEVDLAPVRNGSVWKLKHTPLLARWITDYDCGYETSWWYVIKDTPFDVTKLKAKRRYEITKGDKNFDVKIINPSEYRESLYLVQIAAFSAYPEKYRPVVQKEQFISGIGNWSNYTVFGAFLRDTNDLVGYALLSRQNSGCIDFSVLKTMPEYERLSVNAAIINKILSVYDGFLSQGGYLCDGSRSINHETHFQDYLEKYFGFRKAYCKLHIAYNPAIHWIIKLLYPFKKVLLKWDNIGLVHRINSIMIMEEISRNEALGE